MLPTQPTLKQPDWNTLEGTIDTWKRFQWLQKITMAGTIQPPWRKDQTEQNYKPSPNLLVLPKLLTFRGFRTGWLTVSQPPSLTRVKISSWYFIKIMAETPTLMGDTTTVKFWRWSMTGSVSGKYSEFTPSNLVPTGPLRTTHCHWISLRSIIITGNIRN